MSSGSKQWYINSEPFCNATLRTHNIPNRVNTINASAHYHDALPSAHTSIPPDDLPNPAETNWLPLTFFSLFDPSPLTRVALIHRKEKTTVSQV